MAVSAPPAPRRGRALRESPSTSWIITRVPGPLLDYIRYLDTGNGLKWPCRCAACRARYRVIFGQEEIAAADLATPGAIGKYLQFRDANIAGEVAQIHAIAR